MADDFLSERDPISWSAPEGFAPSLTPAGMYAQDKPSGLEVCLAEAAARPLASDLRRSWSRRRAGRASPVLLAVFYPSEGGVRVSLCGPTGDNPVIYQGLEASQVERLARVALGEPSHHAAARFLLAALPELDSPTPGLRNAGLLATWELRAGVPEMTEWPEAVSRSAPLLASRGRRLVEGLGYGVEDLSVNTWMLTIEGRSRAVAVFCDEDEMFDAPAERFDGATPVSQGLAVADQKHVDWVILTRSSEIRLYAARPDTGVGRKGRAETFVELNLALLPRDKAGYLAMLFSSKALAGGGTLEKILDGSTRFAAELAERLRERVYFEAVPALAKAIAARMGPYPADKELAEAYEQVMVILFRLLFVAYAEDKELLPYSSNHHYRDHSLTQMAVRLLEDKRTGRDRYDDRATVLWDDCRQLWRAVDHGNIGWGVPAYDGGLFSEDPDMSPAGAALASLRLTDAEFAPALARLLIDRGPDGEEGPVDFRSLSVREFGTIYEGLLESRLSVAQDDLTVRKVKGKEMYVPVRREDDPVEIEAGAVFLYNRSGVRKATGSYFTKPFAVEHLLDHALEPALDGHIARLDRLRDAGDEAALARAFFDFRCADIAMGSGHFLVAALDRIEAKLSAWLTLNPVPAVTDELNRLRRTALESLGELEAGAEVETGSLLRRQVARHCVYGVDLNRVAVELARLSIWVHTFVPGLPLSFLDHNLVCGDSLTGVGGLDEAVAAFEPDADPQVPSLFRSQLEELLARAEKSLRRLARTSDATKREIDRARAAHEEAQQAVAPAKALFDVLTANRAGACRLPENYDEDTFAELSGLEEVAEAVRTFQPVHFPAAFPEVFLRDRPGFDCLLGNPPWKETTVEELRFWTLRFPGLKSKSQTQQREEISYLRDKYPALVSEYYSEIMWAKKLSKILQNGQYPGMNTGDPDVYKAFCWRFWHVLSRGGYIGIVLPWSAFAAKGSKSWRRTIFSESVINITMCLNRNEWLFSDVNPGYSICMVGINRLENGGLKNLKIYGKFNSFNEYKIGKKKSPALLTPGDLKKMDKNWCLPAFQDINQLKMFKKLLQHPLFGSMDRVDFYARPYRELDATNDSKYFTHIPEDYPVFNHRNVGHLSWDESLGSFANCDWETVIEELSSRRALRCTRKDSPFYGMSGDWLNDESTLPALNPRIVFRGIIHATNPRKVWFALAPSDTILTNKAPYLLFWHGDITVQSYLLGVMASCIIEWIGHLKINLDLSYFILNSFPVPKFDSTNLIAQQVAQLATGLAIDNRSYWGEWGKVALPISDPIERSDALAQLDAYVAILYGLNESDLTLLYDTLPERIYGREHYEMVLKHYRRIA